jgi:hypothetical protein
MNARTARAGGRGKGRLVPIAALGTAAVLAGWAGAGAQQPGTRTTEEQAAYRNAMEQADLEIQAAEKQHSEAIQNEEYLTTFIGPRLTGSPGMQKASQWTLEMFKRYGLDAHLETTQIPHAWYRGNDWGQITSPLQNWMIVHSAAWGQATAGPVSGPLAVIDPNAAPEEVSSHPEKYKDAIVLTDEPPGPAVLPQNPPNAYNAVIPSPRGVRKPSAESPEERAQRLRAVMEALGKAGANAMLRDSQKPYELEVDAGTGTPYQPSALPIAYVSHGDYEWLLRLAKAGAATFQIELAGTFSPGPGTASTPWPRSRAASCPTSG